MAARTAVSVHRFITDFDGTVSHLTKLSKNDSQVIGFDDAIPII